MPDALAQNLAFSATLDLQDSIRVCGGLSSLKDGSLQLCGSRLLQGPSSGGKVSLRPGMVATLSLDHPDSYKQPPDISPVTLTRIAGDSITLEFADPSGATARRYRDIVGSATPPSIAVRATPLTGATAQYTELLVALKDYSLEQLDTVLQHFLGELSGYLLDLSSRIKPAKAGENPHYEASVKVQHNAKQIIRDMLEQIEALYQDLQPAVDEDQLWRNNMGDADELDLIDIKEFEDYLAIDSMVALGEELNKITLEALLIRLATLIDADPNKVRLPVHVRQLCRAFQASMKKHDMPRDVISHILDYFAKHFIPKLHDYYEPINEGLEKHNIDPGLEEEIRLKGSLLKTRRQARRAQQKIKPAEQPIEKLAADAQNPALDEAHRQLGEKMATTVGHFNPENLYRSVIDALNFKREAEGLADGENIASGVPVSGTWDGATVPSADLDQRRLADADAIARALGSLQRDSQVRADVQQSDSLRQYLASNKEQIGSLRDSSGLTAASLDQLDMVDNLFGTIKSQLDVSSEMQPALGNLQIPLAKLALLDPRFFVDRSHSARTVVDKLSQLATSANFPNKALEGRINGIVDEIVADYESDSSVFELALEKIDKLAAQQERALSRNIERVVRTQEGQEKLQKAKQAVGKVISSRLQPPMAPRVLMDLVDSGWRDLLILTHVK